MLPRFDGLEPQDAEMGSYLQSLLSVCGKLMRREVSRSTSKAVFSRRPGIESAGARGAYHVLLFEVQHALQTV